MINDLKKRAKGVIKGKQNKLAFITFLYAVIVILLANYMIEWVYNPSFLKYISENKNLFIINIIIRTPIFLFFFSILISAIDYGYSKYFMNMRIGAEKWTDLFWPLRNIQLLSKIFLVELRRKLVIFLYALFFLVPAATAKIKYELVSYIILDDYKIGINRAFKKSSFCMRGNYINLFLLSCSFIYHIALGIITLGIGFFYIVPYIKMTFIEFYEEVKLHEKDERSLRERVIERFKRKKI